MRNTGLFPATQQSSEGGKSAVKTQENLTFPLCFPQGEGASPSTVSLSQWTTMGIRSTSLSRERLSVHPMSASSDVKGVHVGREAMMGQTPSVIHGSFCTAQCTPSGRSVALEITHQELGFVPA